MKLKFFGKKKDKQDEDKDVFDEIEEQVDKSGKVVEESFNQDETADEEWLEDEEEGQLAVDVYQDKSDNIVIKSTIAGVKPEDVDVNINNDMVTIRGARSLEEEVEGEDYFYQECYWGNFSRSIVLPQEVIAEKAQASIKNGVLTIVLPKAKARKPVAVKVKEN